MARASAHPTARTEAPPTASGLPECHWCPAPAAPVEGGPLSDAGPGRSSALDVGGQLICADIIGLGSAPPGSQRGSAHASHPLHLGPAAFRLDSAGRITATKPAF